MLTGCACNGQCPPQACVLQHCTFSQLEVPATSTQQTTGCGRVTRSTRTAKESARDAGDSESPPLEEADEQQPLTQSLSTVTDATEVTAADQPIDQPKAHEDAVTVLPPSPPSSTGARQERGGPTPSKDGRGNQHALPDVIRDSQAAASGMAESEVEIVKAFLYKAPRASSGALKLEELAGLPHTPYALYTMGGGRCPIAAPMLAVGNLPDSHGNQHCKARVDAERIALGESMQQPGWSEERWMREVPVALRMDRVSTGWHVDPSKRTPARTSYHALHQLLTDPTKNLEWLEPSVFYLTADKYDVGIFVVQVYPERGSNNIYYHHIRPHSKRHIVIWFANGHYQCVQYNQQRVFSSNHEFAQRLQQLSLTRARPVGPDPDIDLEIISEDYHSLPSATPPRLPPRAIVAARPPQ